MDPKAKEKHEEEHEDSKKKEKPEQPLYRESQDYQPNMKAIKQK